MAIKNINDLRRHAIGTIEKLERGDVDVSEVSVLSKLYDSVVSSLKVELQYAHLQGISPEIPFLEGEKMISHSNIKSIK